MSFLKNEHPCITVSQNANEKRTHPPFVMLRERTPVSLSLPGHNCVASLFVEFFTLLLMSTRIKMTVQSGVSEAHSPPHTHTQTLTPFHEKRKHNQKNVSKNPFVCASLSVCLCFHGSICALNLKWFLEWERTILRSEFPL